MQYKFLRMNENEVWQKIQISREKNGLILDLQNFGIVKIVPHSHVFYAYSL